MWSWALQMKQLSPGFMPGTLRGCFLSLVDLLGAPSLSVEGLKFFFLGLYFDFLDLVLGSLGGVGWVLGNNSGFPSLNRFRANLCLLLTI